MMPILRISIDERENPNLSISQAQIKLRTCITILSLFKIQCTTEKITFLYFKRIQKVLKKNHTSDLDVPESNPHDEDEDQNCRSLINLKSSMTRTLILAHFRWEEKKSGGYGSQSL